ncbi:unnamed protein product [Pedinophyceae sp. YPF-701]|nr:unnamed protein product [Pedinophyceae sp. YPF-701]
MGAAASRLRAVYRKQQPASSSVATPLTPEELQCLRSCDYVLGRQTGNVHEFFHLMDVLGEGQFGLVRKAEHRATKRVYACKTIAKAQLRYSEEVQDIRREVQIMQHLGGHPNIVQIHAAFEDQAHVHIVMEYCRGGELFDRLLRSDQYTEREASYIMHSIISTLAHMHQLGVIHRDIKPENFLLDVPGDDATMKLTDFGLSMFFRPGQTFNETLGSEHYAAPEVWPRVVPDPTSFHGQLRCPPSYNEKADVWSCGVIMYILLSGSPPFRRSDTDTVLRLSGGPWQNISSSAKSLVASMLTRDPARRPDAASLLRHPWLTSVVPSKPLGNAVLQRLSGFSRMNKFKRKALHTIVSGMQGAETLGLVNLFESLDEDGSGSISVSELRKALAEQSASFRLPDWELEAIIDEVALDTQSRLEHKISLEEFLAATINASQLMVSADGDHHIRRAFAELDADGDGVLTRVEIMDALGMAEDDESDADELDAILQEVDADGDGRIAYTEFLSMVLGVSTRRGALPDLEAGVVGTPPVGSLMLSIPLLRESRGAGSSGEGNRSAHATPKAMKTPSARMRRPGKVAPLNQSVVKAVLAWRDHARQSSGHSIGEELSRPASALAGDTNGSTAAERGSGGGASLATSQGREASGRGAVSLPRKFL